MNTGNAVEVRDLKKVFKVYHDKGKSLKERVLFFKRSKFERRNVLDGISFDVKQGEAVGIIGHNGCGKSTTLKLLSKIIYPTEGTIEMRGRVSCLIELGAGFHPDMSGRENIYMNASIFGLGKKEIDKRIDDIITFSELEKFIDDPVRTYSSGMYMRLAFSVAINVDADILLIDEILAVGDAHFQEKCFDRLKEIKNNGTTIIIVSHSLGQIEEICDRTIWIDAGKIKEEGEPSEVHESYLNFMNVRHESKNKAVSPTPKRKRESDKTFVRLVTEQADGTTQTISAESLKRAKLVFTEEDKTEKSVCFSREGQETVLCRFEGQDHKTDVTIRESDVLGYLNAVDNQVAEDVLPAMRLNENCERTEDAVLIKRKGVISGPYKTLERGRYRLLLEAEFHEDMFAEVNVTADAGAYIISRYQLKYGENEIVFQLKERMDNIEFSIINNENNILVKRMILQSIIA